MKSQEQKDAIEESVGEREIKHRPVHVRTVGGLRRAAVAIIALERSRPTALIPALSRSRH
ncbi:hypothetical protein KAU37_08000 [Candidatus Bipolaricaulota bacterium]|nr:hypothetical protein [Candidatus Bipolaricaulota bacterium]